MGHASPPPSGTDLAAIPLPIHACPECGSAGMRPMRLGEGGVPGANEISDKLACPRCGYRGLAIEFDDRDEYAEFLADLAEAA